MSKPTKQDSITQRLLKSKDAAKYLGICARKLWDLTNEGRVPSVRFDRVVRYDVADLDTFIQEMKGGAQ